VSDDILYPCDLFLRPCDSLWDAMYHHQSTLEILDFIFGIATRTHLNYYTYSAQ
jgi:hypothetical protein